jgi:hypothetical protein
MIIPGFIDNSFNPPAPAIKAFILIEKLKKLRRILYSPLVRKGGIIAFHDIVPGPPEYVGGVPRFWNEIKNKFDHIEIVRDWKQGSYGIGIIYVS